MQNTNYNPSTPYTHTTPVHSHHVPYQSYVPYPAAGELLPALTWTGRCLPVSVSEEVLWDFFGNYGTVRGICNV